MTAAAEELVRIATCPGSTKKPIGSSDVADVLGMATAMRALKYLSPATVATILMGLLSGASETTDSVQNAAHLAPELASTTLVASS